MIWEEVGTLLRGRYSAHISCVTNPARLMMGDGRYIYCNE